MSTLLSVRTEETTLEQLDRIAESLDRNRNWVINEAIRHYVEMHAWRLEHVKQGMADTDAGRSITTDDVRARIKRHHAERTQKA
jgi:predicted transcriptional regulator